MNRELIDQLTEHVAIMGNLACQAACNCSGRDEGHTCPRCLLFARLDALKHAIETDLRAALASPSPDAMREALEFYADPIVWKNGEASKTGEWEGYPPEALEDEGKRARAALASAAPSMTEHVLYETSDKDRPESICDSNGEVVLAQCRRCGKAEADLDMNSPCQLMTMRERGLLEAAKALMPLAHRIQNYCENGDTINFDNFSDEDNAVEYANAIAMAESAIAATEPTND